MFLRNVKYGNLVEDISRVLEIDMESIEWVVPEPSQIRALARKNMMANDVNIRSEEEIVRDKINASRRLHPVRRMQSV